MTRATELRLSISQISHAESHQLENLLLTACIDPQGAPSLPPVKKTSRTWKSTSKSVIYVPGLLGIRKRKKSPLSFMLLPMELKQKIFRHLFRDDRDIAQKNNEPHKSHQDQPFTWHFICNVRQHWQPHFVQGVHLYNHATCASRLRTALDI